MVRGIASDCIGMICLGDQTSCCLGIGWPYWSMAVFGMGTIASGGACRRPTANFGKKKSTATAPAMKRLRKILQLWVGALLSFGNASWPTAWPDCLPSWLVRGRLLLHFLPVTQQRINRISSKKLRQLRRHRVADHAGNRINTFCRIEDIIIAERLQYSCLPQ